MVNSPPKLALGTVQWGLPYGIANKQGKPDRGAVRAMLDLALTEGVDLLDTARAYGESEAVIGELLTARERSKVRIITKLSPNVWKPELPLSASLEAVKTSVDESLGMLGLDSIDTLLLHRANQRLVAEGAIWNTLLEMRRRGTIKHLGISAQTPSEAIQALDVPEIDVIQVAANILDQRLARADFFESARKLSKEIHIRSVYLQGVAFLPIETLPKHLIGAKQQLEAIASYARDRGFAPWHIWILYARTLSASRLVLGAENTEQLRLNLELFNKPLIDELNDLLDDVNVEDASIIDPARWIS